MSVAITKLLFLPGAGGDRNCWRPVSEKLRHPAARTFMGWPGFGGVPPDPTVHGLDELVTRVVAEIDQPVALLAQSMGGIIAVLAALAKPEWVRHLVLAATSGGIDVHALGASDWRPHFARQNPDLPRWFLDERRDLSARLPELRVPALLLWGDADPISPVSVGKRLNELLPRAELHVIAGGDHDLIRVHADAVASSIEQHLRASERPEFGI